MAGRISQRRFKERDTGPCWPFAMPGQPLRNGIARCSYFCSMKSGRIAEKQRRCSLSNRACMRAGRNPCDVPFPICAKGEIHCATATARAGTALVR